MTKKAGQRQQCSASSIIVASEILDTVVKTTLFICETFEKHWTAVTYNLYSIFKAKMKYHFQLL